MVRASASNIARQRPVRPERRIQFGVTSMPQPWLLPGHGQLQQHERKARELSLNRDATTVKRPERALTAGLKDPGSVSLAESTLLRRGNRPWFDSTKFNRR